MRPPTGGGPPRYQEIMAAICDDISSGRFAVRFDPAAIWDVCERHCSTRSHQGGRDWAVRRPCTPVEACCHRIRFNECQPFV